MKLAACREIIRAEACEPYPVRQRLSMANRGAWPCGAGDCDWTRESALDGGIQSWRGKKAKTRVRQCLWSGHMDKGPFEVEVGRDREGEIGDRNLGGRGDLDLSRVICFGKWPAEGAAVHPVRVPVLSAYIQ